MNAQRAEAQPSTDIAGRAGVAYGLAAYGAWGLVPLYFKAVIESATAWEVLAHRALWSSVLLLALVAATGQLGQLRRTLFASPGSMAALAASTLLISSNWFAFIWAHETDQVLQASLGYFINPLITVALGYAVLGERLRPLQVLSIAIAAVAVAYRTVGMGEAPLLALFLSGTFAAYGLIRKLISVEAMLGLTVETILLAPLCGGYLAWASWAGQGSFATGSTQTDLLLLAGGVVTALPLLWFTSAARRLRLVTLGFLQFLAPSLQFVIAIAVFEEPLVREQLICFAAIWAALGVYCLDALRSATRRESSADSSAKSP